MPFPVLLSTLIRSWFHVKPATLLIVIDLQFLVYGVLQCLVPKRLSSLPLLMWGVVFHCLRRFSAFFYSFSFEAFRKEGA
jgi:hypothetical protein